MRESIVKEMKELSKLSVLRQSFMEKIKNQFIKSDDESDLYVYDFGDCSIHMYYDDNEYDIYYRLYERNQYLIKSYTLDEILECYQDLLQSQGLELKYSEEHTRNLLFDILNNQFEELAHKQQYLDDLALELAYVFLFILAYNIFKNKTTNNVSTTDVEKVLFESNEDLESVELLKKLTMDMIVSDTVLLEIIEKRLEE